MEFFKTEYKIDFMGKRKLAFVISAALILISIAAVIMRGLNFGVDFTGGTVLEVGYQDTVELPGIRTALAEAGFEGAVVQYFGSSSEVLIRLAPEKDNGSAGNAQSTLADRVMGVLKKASNGEAEMRRIEFVGPQIGEELRDEGGLALIFALGGILIYVALRFEFRFSLGSIIALVHDVIITIGFFAITQIEFDLTVLAAVLAVIGYSLNDTIVVFDRIRENFVAVRKGTTEEVMNASINQTLSRTIMTGLTTIMVLVALYFFGGEILRGFSVALLVGVLIGTYSSIYVASAAALAMGVSREDLLPTQKDTSDIDHLP